MEGRDGHVSLGLVFFIIGLWHLFNNLKNHATQKTYRSLAWFPISFIKYLELYLILLGCTIFIFMEVGHSKIIHDGAIRSSQLNHIEHSSIAVTFFLHAVFSILLDKTQPKPIPKLKTKREPKSHIDMGHFTGALAFAQELLLFHLHSTDHVDLESQYHWLLQQVIFVCLITTLLSIWVPKSFMVSYIRSLGVIFQGLWLIVMGFMLWTPGWAPKGCSLSKDDHGRSDIIKCGDERSLDRGKALVNILFSWFLIGIMAFGVISYLVVNKVYGGNVLMVEDGEEERCKTEDRQGFLYAKGFVKVDFEE